MPPINVFAFNSLANWRRVLNANPPVQGRYRLKLAGMLATSAIGSPFEAWERLRYADRIAATRVHPQPLFIIGPGRSGTTHLHNLIAQDPQFGYVSTLQGVAPNFVVGSGGLLRKMVQRTLPKTRPMDNVAVSLDAPQEEEVALANISPHSFLHHLLFPQRMRWYFEKYYLQSTMTEEERAAWREDYLWVLKTASLLSHGKPLVLKTPINSGRVPELLRMFPEARFIAIRRDPLRIVLSTRNMYDKIIPPHQLQDVDMETVHDNNVDFLVRGMKKWYADRGQIAPGRVVDVRYEDLAARPLETLTRAYDHLGLDYEAALPRWEAYLQSIEGYRRNRFLPTPKDVVLAQTRLRWLYQTWDYPFPEEQ